MILLAVLTPLMALGLMLALQVLETRMLEAGPTPQRPGSRQPSGPSRSRAGSTEEPAR